jgi:CheY-like chemotaxis protein
MEKKTKILIVEDEIIVAMSLRRSLQSGGYDVCGLSVTGEEALQDTAEHRPDVVLMDIHLPGEMDGIEAAQTIREQFATPIIFMTGYSEKVNDERVKQVHPAAYLTKPVQPRQLAEAIDRAMVPPGDIPD